MKMSSPMPAYTPAAIAIVGIVAMGMGCENRIGRGRALAGSEQPRSDAGIFKGNPDAQVPPMNDAGEPPPPPPDAGTVTDPFPFAAVGSHCVDDAQRTYLILSGEDLDCATFGQMLADGPDGSVPVAYVALEDTSSLGARRLSAQVCLSVGNCQTRSLDLNISQIGESQTLVARYTIELDDGRAEGDVRADWCDFDAALPGGGALATDIAMTEVSIYQGVKITLMQDGSPKTPNAPVIGGRPALIRVFIAPEANFQARDIVARLTIESPGQAPVELEETVRVSITSAETRPDSTFNFTVPATALSLDAGFSVGLYEAGGGCGGGGGSPDGVLYPTSGTAELDPLPTGGALRVVLVPVRYNADGSGRLPDTTPAQLDRYKDTMFKLFPVPDVSLTVREPLDYDGSIQRNGAGWSNILQTILDLRNSDRPDARTYYYGIFAPASSFRNYCNGGCVTGLGPVPGAGNAFSRGAVGVGFSGESATETFVHEIGHAMGRQHAPCGTQDADPGFPYGDGGIGVWGFDLLAGNLLNPNENSDMMGYCDPTWISDYTYEALYRRLAAVNGARPFTSSIPQEFKVLMDDMDGVRWGHTVELERSPQGEDVVVTYRDDAGTVLSTATVQSFGYDHIPGRYLLLPEPPEGARAVDVPGAGQIVF